jgi:hypothetical protein
MDRYPVAMIIAGIDEAGYGPLLGPLVVGCCAFRVEDAEFSPADNSLAELPCIWKRLAKVASKKRQPSGKKLHINDSKLVYSPSNGLHELERSVLAILQAANAIADDATTPLNDLASLLSMTANHVLNDLPAYPWYQPSPGERFPLEQESLSLKLFANAVKAEMTRNKTFCVAMRARIVLERQLNQMMQATRNKASALFSTGAIHIDYLLKTFGDQNLTIFCDRQGGRERYGSLLRLMFEDWSLEVLHEADDSSDYLLHRGPHVARIVFREKAEQQCLSVALASMLSKYLREALMQRFNAYWIKLVPNVAPTAGYYQDGTRFLRDIQPKLAELKIADESLIRAR